METAAKSNKIIIKLGHFTGIFFAQIITVEGKRKFKG